MCPNIKDLTIVVKPLGQYRTKVSKREWTTPLGMYFQTDSKSIKEDTILLDPRQNQKSFLNTLIHEMLHRECPGWTESKVIKTANNIANVVWKMGYRKEE